MFGKRKSKDENDKGTQSAPDPLSGLGKQSSARSGRSDDQPSPAPLAATSHPASPTPPPSRVGLITAPAARTNTRLGITAPPSGPAAVQALTRGGGASDDPVNEGRSLVVGREICLSGEIKSCERLIIEGKVELSLAESRVLEVTEHGIYQGDAVVENCTIAGLFKGNLSARGRVTLKSTGRIIGTLRYGELEIERGGKASGTLEEAGAAPAAEPVARTKPSATLPDDGPDDGPAEGEKSVAPEPATEPAAEPADAPADQTRPDEQVKAVDAG